MSPFIQLDNENGVRRLNSACLGKGRSYRNAGSKSYPCILDLEVAVPPPPGSHFISVPRSRIACHLNTDLEPTIFQGQVATSLGLAPCDTPDHRIVANVLDSRKRFWCRHKLLVAVGPKYLLLEVWFAVQLGARGWEWIPDFPQWNVLGMRGVLDSRLLCITDSEVYAIERL